ncbi:eotaxin-like [Xyrichtys novacula]|uniref:Eotaxin-like n=1 Tax=Xyrichtys novacula TaxID=13765 RepID=A0AAV1H8G2_XYRNO|nr:eotaxin-like [Xyrichtys novacula]
MSMKILPITVLLFLVCFWSSADSRRHNLRGPSKHHPPPPCCTKVSTADVSADVIGDTYQEQAAHPPCVKALIFNTEYGQVCIGTHVEWAKELAANMTKL